MKKLQGLFELEPAYGRDYKTKEEAIQAFRQGKDFLGDWQIGFKPVGIDAFAPGAVVNLRYAKKRKVAVFTVGETITIDQHLEPQDLLEANEETRKARP